MHFCFKFDHFADQQINQFAQCTQGVLAIKAYTSELQISVKISQISDKVSQTLGKISQLLIRIKQF